MAAAVEESCPLIDCQRSCDVLSCVCKPCTCGECLEREDEGIKRGTYAIQCIGICESCGEPVKPGELYLDPPLRHASPMRACNG